MNDAFYVGYEALPPDPIRRLLRRIAAWLGTASLTLAIVLAAGQVPFPASRFEYGRGLDYEGELVEWPYPMLVVAGERHLLVGEGKFGFGILARGHDGELVRLRGSLIQRGPDKMLQVEAGSLRAANARAQAKPQRVDLGDITLTGEIVDTKCHLGVMNPGEGKVHRECAVRCISGGAPPGFLVRDEGGTTRLLLLTGSDGRAFGREVLDYVAEPITIYGRLIRQGTTLVLQAEPKEFRRE